MQKRKRFKFKVGDIICETIKNRFWIVLNSGYIGKDYPEYTIKCYDGKLEDRTFPIETIERLCKKATKAQIVLYAKTSL